MNETPSNNGNAVTRRGTKKVRLAIAVVALVGLGSAIGVVATEGSEWRGWKEWRHHGPASEADVREHAKHFSARILDKVDASEAQREQIDEAVGAFVTDAWPLREQHREHRQALIEELGRPEVRREVLEDLRARELALADAFSGELLEALVAVSGILDAEQRVALVERMGRHHHRRHHN